MTKQAWTEVEIAAVRRCYEGGATDAQIACSLNRSEASVSNCRQSHGITRPRHSLKRGAEWTDGEFNVAEALYREGWSYAAIGTRVGRSAVAVKRMVTERGVKRDRAATVDPARFDIPDEAWRVCIPGYAVSSKGRVMSLHPSKLGTILSPWIDPDGYHHVSLQVGARSKRHAVHALVANAFHGARPTPAHQAAHNNGISGDNRSANLRWATPQQNQADRLLHGSAERYADGRFIRRRRGTADMVRRAREAGLPIWEPCAARREMAEQPREGGR